MYNSVGERQEDQSSAIGELSPIASANQSQYPANNKLGATMMDQEMKQIAKIKMKQKKEIEQMIDYEMKLAQIKKKHEKKAQLMKAKELRHQAEIRRKQILQEEKKARDD